MKTSIISRLTNWVKTHKIAGFSWLMLQAALYSWIPVLFYQYVAVPSNWTTFPEEDANFRLSGLNTSLWLVLGWAFYGALKNYIEMMAAIRTNQEEAFQKEYYRRIPEYVFYVLAVFIFWVFCLHMQISYETVPEGKQIIFGTFFRICIFIQLVAGLDDPPHSILYEKKVPKRWLENIEELDKELKKAEIAKRSSKT